MTILDEIVAHKKIEVEQLKKMPVSNKPTGKRSLLKTIDQNRYIDIIAEIKRGSPSKGPFSMDLDINKQVDLYNQNNVSCISVLVDSKFFYGSYNDLELVRSLTDKPILCKEFIIDKIQIDLAASKGADLILLIERILDRDTLESFITYAHQLNLEVLVEVDSLEGFNNIKDLDFTLCGVNNRNLKDFSVDLKKTTELASTIKSSQKRLISESGIHTREDILFLRNHCIDGLLIGESIVKNIELLETFNVLKKSLKIKICGITDKRTAAFLDGKVDMIGLVFAQSKRQVDIIKANNIIEEVNESHIVGVFKNQTKEDIINTFNSCRLDFVQLYSLLSLPISDNQVIRAVDFDSQTPHDSGYVLIDHPQPGNGLTYDLSDVNIKSSTLILAGGLNITNVESRVKLINCIGVDVSSGVETNGIKDLEKLAAFIEKVRIL